MLRLHPDARQLGRLQELTDAALGHLELEELLGALLERTRRLLDADTCAILLLDEESNELVARAAVGIEEEVEHGVRVPVGKGFAGRVAATQQPVVLRDVDHADVLNPILREKGIKSLLGVPLVVQGSVVGVLHVGSLEARDFAPNELELLQLAADRAAIAIEHARLFEAERAARKKLEGVQAVTDIALAHLELDDLLPVLLPRIRDILATDTCAVLLLDETHGDLVPRAALGLEEEVERGIRIPVGKGFAGRIAATGRPVILDDHAAAVHSLRPGAPATRCGARRGRDGAGPASRGADPARRASRELRRNRVARASHAGGLRLRRGRDALRARGRPHPGDARRVAPNRLRARRSPLAPARSAPRSLAARVEADPRLAETDRAAERPLQDRPGNASPGHP